MGGIRRLFLITGDLLYVLFLNWAYIAVIVPRYEYMGFVANSVQPSYVFFAWLIAVVPSLWMPVRLQRPSQVIYWLLYVLVFVPAILIPLYTLTGDINQWLIRSLSLLGAVAMLAMMYTIAPVRIPVVPQSRLVFWLTLIVFTIVSYGYAIGVFGADFKLVSLWDVYTVRAEYKATLQHSSGIIAYLTSWQGNAINPFLISYGLVHRLPVLLLLGVAGQFFLYSITGFKSVLFSGVLVLALYIALRNRGNSFGLYVIWGATTLVLLSALMKIGLQREELSSLLLQRVFAVPGLLTGYYFDFFSQHQTAMLGDSRLRFLFPSYPYDLSIPNLIGEVYFGRPDSSANANLWADAYANFGFWGVFGFTFALGFLFWFLDSLARGRDPRIVSLVQGMPGFTLANASLMTSIFTHGIGFLIFMVCLMPKVRTESDPLRGSEGLARKV